MTENVYEVNLLDLAPDSEGVVEKLNFETCGDVLIYYMNKYGGKLDLRLMAEISGFSVEKLTSELAGAIYQDPAAFREGNPYELSVGWVLSPVYLCGNIRHKLKLATEKNKVFCGLFQKNIDALEKMLPDNVSFEDIHYELGSTFIEESFYSLFIKETFSLNTMPEVKYLKEPGLWSIQAPKGAANVLNHHVYGTADISGIKLIEYAMNCRTVRVYDYFTNERGGVRRELNRERTLEAQEKQSRLCKLFKEWVSSIPRMRQAIEERYNNEFACYAHSNYDGSFLMLKDLNARTTPYRHQKNAVARVLLSESNILFSHEVGSGKTDIMCISAHELHRTGVSKKNLIVVPNSVLGATIAEHKKLYPNDKILEVYPKDFGPLHRTDVLKRIKTEDSVAIYMAYSSYNMILMSKNYWIEKYRAEIHSLRIAKRSAADARERSLLETEERKLSKKLRKYTYEYNDPNCDTFDHLGIETLFLDEAHNYKNIEIKTHTDNIVGLNSSGSLHCMENLEKVHYVKKAVFLTGTPLTNSLADMYALMKYLQPYDLRALNLTFDNWVHVYAQKTEDLECDVANNVKVTTRFRQFNNITELCALFSSIHDYHKPDKDDSGLPSVKYQNVVVKRNPLQAEYINNLAERVEAVHRKEVSRTEDNLLKITIDGRKAALDIRLVKPEGTAECTGKVEACAAKIMNFKKLYPDKCQVVFCDIGTPKDSYNVYDSLKEKLIALGMKEQEIAFVHDATNENERSKLFSDVNSAEISVIIGSTFKLGTGTNIQEKLIAAHHLDVPWRPADMVQREGRIIRRGNSNPTVFVFRYITEKSFDAFSWQLLHNKQRFIASFLSGYSTGRETTDIGETVLTYSEVKALAIGNKLIRKRVETYNLLERSKIAFRQRVKQLSELKKIIDDTPQKIADTKKKIEECRLDMEHSRKSKEPIPNEERQAFGEELLNALAKNAYHEKERLFSEYRGFTIWLPAYMKPDDPYVYIKNGHGGSYAVQINTLKPLGVSRKIDHLLDTLDTRIATYQAYIARLNSDMENAEREYRRGNRHSERVEALERELNRIDLEIEKGGTSNE